MKKLIVHALTICAISWTLIGNSTAGDPAKIYTSYITPVVMDDPERPGAAYEIVSELFKMIGEDYEIIPVPWARAQHKAKTTPGALIFPFSWTPTRAPDFVWKVQILSNQTHFITFNNVKMTAKSARGKRIGVQLKSSWDNWLTERGYQNVHRIPGDGSELIKLLRNKRIDAWYTDQIIADSVLHKLTDQEITYSEPVQSFRTFLATNKKAPYPHMDKLNTAMSELVKSEKFDEIFKKYGISPKYQIFESTNG